jgi:hypothetical protein
VPRKPRRNLAATASLALAALITILASAPAFAVSLPHPEPPKRLTVQGTLKGRFGKGGKLNFNIVATDPLSFLHLKSVKVSVLLHGFSIQDVEFFVADQTIDITGRQPVKFGGRPLSGSFLRLINGNTSRYVRSTFGIRLIFWTRVDETIPRGVQLRLVATDQDGKISQATNRVTVPRGLLTWGTLGLAAALALFGGAFAGNKLTVRRYRQRAPTIWQIVERRLLEQRARPPSATDLAGVSEGAGMSEVVA